MPEIGHAIRELENALAKLRGMAERGGYKMVEMRDARRIILEAVRNHIDPYLPHMPDERHY